MEKKSFEALSSKFEKFRLNRKITPDEAQHVQAELNKQMNISHFNGLMERLDYLQYYIDLIVEKLHQTHKQNY